MLEVRDLCFRYGKRRPVLENVSLTLRDGEIGILLGKNGAGKTTLFKLLLGLETPESGTILFDGQDLTKLPRRQRARCVGYVPQHIHFGALTVYDSVLLGRIAYFGLRAGQADHAAVSAILADMGLEPIAHRTAETLSGGEKQKVAIARALAQEPRLLIFDEPTGNLDLANEALIIQEAKKVARAKNIAILSSLHDLNQALDMGDTFFFLKDGAVRYTGGPEIFRPETIEDVFDVRPRVAELDGRKIIIGGYHE